MGFQVLKSINNNVVSCMDEHQREHIVTGRGLGFAVKRGEIIPKSSIEKVFCIADEAQVERLKELFNRLPREQVEFCTELIQYAYQVVGRSLNESIYFTLCDHISFAIQRVQQGISFANALHTEVRLFYPLEYSVGQYAVSQVATRFHVTLPDDEAASIALHLVNAQHEMSLGITMQVTQALGQMLHIIETHPDFALDAHSIYFDELMVHLKFLALEQFSHESSPTQDSQLAPVIQDAFPKEYQLAHLLTLELEHASQRPMTPEQLAYLAIHLHRVAPKNHETVR